MARLIDADQFKAKMLSFMDRKAPTPSETDCILDGVLNLLEEQPTIYPVKHGHWIFTGRTYKCSNCCLKEDNAVEADLCDMPLINFKYCPNCGAKMDKKPISDSAYWQGENKDAT